jgi:hypothetical protein
MRLNAPKKWNWWLTLILAIVAIIANFMTIPGLSPFAFIIILIAYLLLWLGTFMKGL